MNVHNTSGPHRSPRIKDIFCIENINYEYNL